MASNIYQIPILTPQPLSKGQINEVKRDAVSQAYWWSFPNENISAICRKMNKLKIHTGFDFLHGSNYEGGKRDINMKPRISVRKMQPSSLGEIKWIPEVIQKHEELVKFDFQRLKIAFHIIMKLILLKQPIIQLEEFLEHPLISLYSFHFKAAIWATRKLSRLANRKVAHIINMGRFSIHQPRGFGAAEIAALKWKEYICIRQSSSRKINTTLC